MRRRLLCTAAAVLLLSSCSVGDIRQTPRRPAASPTAAVVPPRASYQHRADEVREAKVPVPSDFSRISVQFEDAGHGYALYTRCGTSGTAGLGQASCTAALMVTTDGGRSWNGIPHPEAIAVNHQMFVGAGRVVLLAEPHAWYLSEDRARTFAKHPWDPSLSDPYAAVDERFQVCCFRDGGRLAEWVGDRARETIVQPPVPGLRAVASRGSTIYAAGLSDGGLRAAISFDAGKTWRRPPVAGDSTGMESAGILVSHDGTDVWLIAQRGRVPHLWRYDQVGWRPVASLGAPGGPIDAVALGGGVVLTIGPWGPGLLKEGTYRKADWPVGSISLRLLTDGSLFGDDGANTWLGVGTGEERRWIKIVLEPVM